MFSTKSTEHLSHSVPGVRGSGVGRQFLSLVALSANFLHVETFFLSLLMRLADNIVNVYPKLTSTFLMAFKGTSAAPGLYRSENIQYML